jgi:hypothetical protein
MNKEMERDYEKVEFPLSHLDDRAPLKFLFTMPAGVV